MYIVKPKLFIPRILHDKALLQKDKLGPKLFTLPFVLKNAMKA